MTQGKCGAIRTKAPDFQTKTFLDVEYVLLPDDDKVLEELFLKVRPLVNRATSDQQGALAKLRDTLLPKLLSGELRIPDAEKLVEGSL